MKRILLIHNFYGSSAPSGENQVYENERDLLQSHGHEVYCFTRNSDEIRKDGLYGTIKGGLATPWNPFTQRDLKTVIDKFKPDVAHIHNTFPLISPSAFIPLSDVKTVMTFHNYRYFCVNGIPIRDGKPCTKCLERKNPMPALLHGCYRKSRLATLPLAISSLHLRRYEFLQKYVDGYIAFSDFQKQLLVQQGLDGNKIFLKPNFNKDSSIYDDFSRRKKTVVFVGRLTDEKGVGDLVSAWLSSPTTDYQLEIIGDGEEREKYSRLAGEAKNIRFLGRLTADQTQAKIAQSSLLVLPSVCYEGYPMVLSEACAAGTPVAVSDIGPLPEIARRFGGSVFKTGDPENLGQVLTDLLRNRTTLKLMSNRARQHYLRELTPVENYKKLVNIYESL